MGSAENVRDRVCTHRVSPTSRVSRTSRFVSRETVAHGMRGARGPGLSAASAACCRFWRPWGFDPDRPSHPRLIWKCVRRRSHGMRRPTRCGSGPAAGSSAGGDLAMSCRRQQRKHLTRRARRTTEGHGERVPRSADREPRALGGTRWFSVLCQPAETSTHVSWTHVSWTHVSWTHVSWTHVSWPAEAGHPRLSSLPAEKSWVAGLRRP